jgi:dimethylamine/trimethylamine dehydrogenase
VVDWRLGQLKGRANVSLYPGSTLSADDILGLEHPHVVIATGARWTRMLYGTIEFPIDELTGANVYTPDDLAAGTLPAGPVVVFDFDNYYLAGAIAEGLALKVGEVSYVTTAGSASAWTIMTNELPLIHRALARAGVPVHTLQRVTGFDGARLALADVFTGRASTLPCRSLVIVGMRTPDDGLYQALSARSGEFDRAGIASLRRIGDCLAPGAIVHAVHSGHKLAREFEPVPRTAAGRLETSPYQRDFPA